MGHRTTWRCRSEPCILRLPFKGKSLGGIKLFLECCYWPHKTARFVDDALSAQPSGEWVRDAWSLANLTQATEIYN